MNAQARRVIEAAQRCIGVREAPPRSNNVLFNTSYYGRPVSGAAYPWCMVFVWYSFREAGLGRLFYGGGRTASCTALMNYARETGRFITEGYRPGDVALMNFSGGKAVAEHTGIITGADGASVTTIEGNTADGADSDGGEVMRRARGTDVLIGAYRPAYEEEREMDIREIRKELTDISGTGGAHSQWAAAAVRTLTDAGIFSGDGMGNYGWGQCVTREQLAVVVYRLLEKMEE